MIADFSLTGKVALVAGAASGIGRHKSQLRQAVLGNYTYSAVDLRAAIQALYSGALGSLEWLETRLVFDGAAAFRKIHEGKATAPRIFLRP